MLADRDECEIVLPARLSVDEVQELKEHIIGSLVHADAKIRCIGDEVQEVDAAGLQLLLSLYKYSVQNGGELTIVNPSQDLQRVLGISGADKVFLVEES